MPFAMGAVVDGLSIDRHTPDSGQISPVRAVVPIGFFNFFTPPSDINPRLMLRLSGPFGAGIATVKGNGRHIKVQQGDKTYTGVSEMLGLQTIGVPIPVDAMSWWVRGLPSPNREAAVNMIATAEGTPIGFKQAGWQLSFSQFQRTDQYLLPRKVSGRLGDLSFKLVISDWRFPNN